MALSNTRLRDAIVAAIKARNPQSLTPSQESDLKDYWGDIAKEIIDEFVNFGIVSTVVSTPDTFNGTGTGGIS